MHRKNVFLFGPLFQRRAYPHARVAYNSLMESRLLYARSTTDGGGAFGLKWFLNDGTP